MKVTPLVETRKAMEMYLAPRELPAPPSRNLDCLLSRGRAVPWKEVQFKVSARCGSRVFIAGTFNRWDPSAHPLRYHPADGLFRTTLRLAPGKHQYRFVVNGAWQLDGNCPRWALNSQGTFNSVIQV